MLVYFVLLIPLLPLLTALIVAVGDDASRRARTRLAAFPIGAAFCGAVAALYVVMTQGPISLRFYSPASLASNVSRRVANAAASRAWGVSSHGSHSGRGGSASISAIAPRIL